MSQVGPYLSMSLNLSSKINLDGLKIHSLEQNGDKLVIILEGEDKKINILQCPITVVSGIVNYEIPESYPTIGFSNYYLESAKSLMGGFLLFTKYDLTTPGVLIFADPAGNINVLAENISCYSTNSSNKRKNTIAICRGNNLFVIDDMNSENPLFADAVRDEDILSVALTYPFVYLIFRKGLMQINIDIELRGGNYRPFINMELEPDSTLISADYDSIILYNKHSATYVDSRLSCEKSQVVFNSTPKFNYFVKPFNKAYMSVVDNFAIFYDFSSEYKLPIQDFISFTSNDELGICFYATENELYLVKDYSDTFRLFLNGKYTKAFEMVYNHNGITSFCQFFELLWNSSVNDKYIYRENALNFLSVPGVQKNVSSVLEIFGKLRFYKEIVDPRSGRSEIVVKTNNFYLPSQIDDKESSYPILLSKLKMYCPTENTPEVVDFNTAILEILILLNMTHDVRKFMKHTKNIDITSIKYFAASINYPTVNFIINVFSKQPQEALEAFELIKDPAPEEIKLALSVFKEFSHEWNSFIKYLKRFINRWPIETIEFITSVDDFEIARIANFIEENFVHLKTLFFISAVRLSSLSGHKSVVSSLADQICETLTNIRNPIFEFSSILWLKCVVLSGAKEMTPELLDKSEKELIERLLYLINTFYDEINRQAILAFAETCKFKDLKYQIYLADGNYKEALSIIWTNNKTDIEKALNICKKAKDPTSAFGVALPMMKSSLSKEDFKKILRSVLKENAGIINPNDFVPLLDFGEIGEIFDYITDLYRDLLIQREKSQISCASAEAERFEAKYQLQKAKSVSFVVDNHTLCENCHKPIGSNFFVRTPDGLFYHENCLSSSLPK
ncbi:hypothetical protein TVAG_004540 [Trichomonas vaginalis G3]|uniref:Uncharacterized protein n=1 Tax=Trichomonas vaginalis (strain ATCC PRA-98 / G3) TaxID=412133 RepID=A2DT16_TRIV3|nr:CNH domain containing family [Trichomonas vaginalis G3]EAY16423.1 hypothetical protein TVAG_004540 [Trichomonas vaginalis G3]KAI5505711.1 CNH domain containing family [Trichomonas vaginalis G3]|eukprot:XP_001328646.1 hypothetical protein [Trichomonas vaginalis G3]